MFFMDYLNVNENGHLTVSGVDTLSLAKEYRTPLYVMDENTIRESCRTFKRSMDQYYNGNGRVIYASKALNCLELCRIMNEEDMGLDVVSGGELYTALKAGFPSSRIYFHGNNKTHEELRLALENDVARIMADNRTELSLINSIAGELGKSANVILRVKPGIDAHTHDFVRTGQIDSKFGFALETGEAMDAVWDALSYDNISLKGVHCHIGSQIFDSEPFVLAAEVMLGFMHDVKQKTGITLDELNLGGGFGIKYIASDDAKPYDVFMQAVSTAVKQKAEEYGLPVPFVCIEPGRSIVGPAGLTLYTVGGVKTIPGIRTYVSVDGGMPDNPRYALYRSNYTVLVADRAGEAPSQKVTVAGKCCESGDLIQENIMLQNVKVGDTLAVLSTGAYNYSMANNYNRIPKAPIIMIKNGQPRVIVRRESYEDLTRCDL